MQTLGRSSAGRRFVLLRLMAGVAACVFVAAYWCTPSSALTWKHGVADRGYEAQGAARTVDVFR